MHDASDKHEDERLRELFTHGLDAPADDGFTDAVITHLPEGKDIVIDSKMVLVDYERYCSSSDDLEKKSQSEF